MLIDLDSVSMVVFAVFEITNFRSYFYRKGLGKKEGGVQKFLHEVIKLKVAASWLSVVEGPWVLKWWVRCLPKYRFWCIWCLCPPKSRGTGLVVYGPVLGEPWVFHGLAVTVVGNDDGTVPMLGKPFPQWIWRKSLPISHALMAASITLYALPYLDWQVQANKVGSLCFNFRQDLVPNGKGAHFWLQIVSGNFGDGHRIRFSPSKRNFLPPLKKKVTCGYFRFRQSGFVFSGFGKYFS